jgi:K+ transporter
MCRTNSLGHGIRKLLNLLVNSLAGAEAMFADLGHFSVPAIQVCESSNCFF